MSWPPYLNYAHWVRLWSHGLGQGFPTRPKDSVIHFPIWYHLSMKFSFHINWYSDEFTVESPSTPFPWLLLKQLLGELAVTPTIANKGKWLGNLAKFFVVCFCWLFWGLTLHKTWQKYKRWLRVLIQLTKRSIPIICNSCIVIEHKTKDVQGQGPSNIILACLFASLVFAGLLNHFLLLTMLQYS